MKAFTLIELVIVVIVVGILATLAVTHYASYRENTFDREAQANLRLILAGERIWRMDSDTNQYTACADTQDVNTKLELTIPITNAAWSYVVNVPYGGSSQDFCTQASRTTGAARYWYILAPSSLVGRSLDPQPTQGSCP